ncbi:hypothetical protein TRV_06645 [Trichophyton verrucosum HKI 0517]|uniref:Uncharacterized protein n=1 Tax=Trichophyton verrucosum (strain HKI 0517) TaxID=663202 RepID=D4DHI9_TRIVH|nr:uncharacterized protein TRV_06645 [Trichophyton verrucosum HKI 0517]EFE38656.1 hypothetical protein TRV_06645 [Trichophyton verrucosum HKI 0517]
MGPFLISGWGLSLLASPFFFFFFFFFLFLFLFLSSIFCIYITSQQLQPFAIFCLLLFYNSSFQIPNRPSVLHLSLNMDPDFVHRQFPTSYLRTKLGSEVQFPVESRTEDTALHTAVEDHITNQLAQRQQQQQQQQQQQLPTWQAVDGRQELQHWLRVPPSLTPGPLSTPSASSAERQGSPKPADDSQTLSSSAPPSTLTPNTRLAGGG